MATKTIYGSLHIVKRLSPFVLPRQISSASNDVHRNRREPPKLGSARTSTAHLRRGRGWSLEIRPSTYVILPYLVVLGQRSVLLIRLKFDASPHVFQGRSVVKLSGRVKQVRLTWRSQVGAAPYPIPIPHPTNLALFGHKITLYRFNQRGLILLQGGGWNRSRGWDPWLPLT